MFGKGFKKRIRRLIGSPGRNPNRTHQIRLGQWKSVYVITRNGEYLCYAEFANVVLQDLNKNREILLYFRVLRKTMLRNIRLRIVK